MPIASGSRIGPYEILSQLGAGGMGEVYRVRDIRLGREIALKVLPPEFASNRERLLRFEQEARSASALNHPSIVGIYDIGSADSIAYICMELVDGKNLRTLLREGPLSIRKIVSIFSQIADGLAKAHAAGIVHRDLKPENLMISKDGFLKILDFGLAKITADAGSKGSSIPTETEPGMVLGTVGYMSPEQASGRAVNFHSDQFAFAVILYETLTGKHPFQRATPPETLTAIIREDPEPVSSLNSQTPVPLRWIIERCLAKDPEERYASTRDLARDLQSIRDHISEVTSSAESAVNITRPSYKRSRFLIPFLVLLAFLAGIGLNRWLNPPKDLEPIKFSTLTYSGKDSSPAVSPDGKLIAFRSDRNGTPKIWIKQMAGENEIALTSGSGNYPRFSPDGSTVLFVRTEGTQSSLYKIPVLGGEERKIVEDAQSGDWSPDGKQVAFIRWKGDTSILATVSADGTGIEELLKEKYRLQFPRWSPDGKRIVMIRALDNNVFNVDNILFFDVTSKEKSWIRTTWPTAPVWTGSGDQILYGVSDSAASYPVNLRWSGRVVLQDVKSNKVQSLFWSSGMGDTLDVLDHGRVVYHAASVRENLREVPLAVQSTASENKWFTRGNSIDRQPVYSSDGKRMLFSSAKNGNLDLWEISISNGALRRITEDSTEDWDPGYTPDGKHILWSSGRTGHFEIWMTNADGSGAYQVTQDGYDAENPTMTPDGRWIVYNSYNPQKPGVWKIHPDGSGAANLVRGVTAWPETSPDGRYAAYVWYQQSFLLDPFAFIRVSEIATGKVVPFEIKCGNGNNIGGRVRWLPDGRTFAYVDQNEKGEWGIFLQDFSPGKDTSASRRPLLGFDPDKVAETFAISPDGQSITVAEVEVLSNLVLVENVPGISRPVSP